MAPAAAVELLDIAGSGVMKIGAVAGLASGDYARRATQRWGRAIYEDLQRFAGARYRGAHQNGIAWSPGNEQIHSSSTRPRTSRSETRSCGAAWCETSPIKVERLARSRWLLARPANSAG